MLINVTSIRLYLSQTRNDNIAVNWTELNWSSQMLLVEYLLFARDVTFRVIGVSATYIAKNYALPSDDFLRYVDRTISRKKARGEGEWEV